MNLNQITVPVIDVEKSINPTDGNDILSAGYFSTSVDGGAGNDVITGNNLGMLANVNELPVIDASFEDEKLKNIFQSKHSRIQSHPCMNWRLYLRVSLSVPSSG